MSDWSILKLLAWTTSYFQSHAIESSRLTAEILLGMCLDLKRIDLYVQHDRPLNPDELSAYKSLIKRRVNREPVAYITGRKGFWESEFVVFPGVLIPRPDTELLVEKAMAGLQSDDTGESVKRVLELGTGSGAVIISLAKSLPRHRYVANDISDDALKAFQINLQNILKREAVYCFKGSWFAPLLKKESFDIIVSNPPYVKSADIDTLAPEIKVYEPRSALDGGADGLTYLREIIVHAADYLSPAGLLLLEMAFDQKTEIEDIVNQCAAYEKVEFEKDLSGHYRVAVIKKKIVSNCFF